MSSGWNFGAVHVPGVFNNVPDGISRWDKSSIHANLISVRPHIP